MWHNIVLERTPTVGRTKHDLSFSLEPPPRLADTYGHLVHLASTTHARWRRHWTMIRVRGMHLERLKSLHHVAKSTPLHRSVWSLGRGSLGLGEGTDGESDPSSRYSKREHFSHSLEPGQQLHHYLRHASTWERLPGNDGTIYAVGGLVYGDGHTSEVDAYNQATNIWTKVAPLPWAGETSAVADHGLIYAISGNAAVDGNAGSVAAYNPQTNTWSAVASLPTARSNFAATVSSDGAVYVMGGSGTDGVTNNRDGFLPIQLLIVGQLWLHYQNQPPILLRLLAPMELSTSLVMILVMALLLVQPTLTVRMLTPGVKSLACLSTLVHGGSKVLVSTTAPDGTIYAFSAGCGPITRLVPTIRTQTLGRK